MRLINISNHKLTEEQKSYFSEVIELPKELSEKWGQMSPKTAKSVIGEIIDLINDTCDYSDVIHVAGYPAAVCHINYMANQECVFAHSIRESQEYTAEDGSVQKKNIFRFQGWYRYHDFAKLTKS